MKVALSKTITSYEASNCAGCPLRGVCHKGKGNRIIEVNHNLKRHRQKAREPLTSEQGIAHRTQRAKEVEAVFGNIKHNKGFRRFLLRGKQQVTTEFGWVAIAHNLSKKAAKRGYMPFYIPLLIIEGRFYCCS